MKFIVSPHKPLIISPNISLMFTVRNEQRWSLVPCCDESVCQSPVRKHCLHKHSTVCIFSAHSSLDTAWRAFRPAWARIHISPAVLCWKYRLQSLSWSAAPPLRRTYFAPSAEAPFLWERGTRRRVWVWIPPGGELQTQGSWPWWTETCHWADTAQWASSPCLYYESLIHACWWTQTSCPLLSPGLSS